MIALSLPHRGVAFSRRWANRAATLLLAVSLTALLLLLAGWAAGFRPLVEHSGSMAPAITAGDLLLTHRVPATDIRIRDVVSFHDPLHPGVPTTHRVAALRRAGGRLIVTTRGDANQVGEQWATAASGQVTRTVLHLPAVGYALNTLANRWLRLVLLTCALSAATLLALRRIWRTG